MCFKIFIFLLLFVNCEVFGSLSGIWIYIRVVFLVGNEEKFLIRLEGRLGDFEI